MAAIASAQSATNGVNDVHSRLNPTRVAEVWSPRNSAQASEALHHAARANMPVALCGGRHAMGGQQFASNGLLIDLSGLDRILNFDPQSGLIEVEAGIQWPALISGYLGLQKGRRRQWGIRQKQTGADRLSIGGALAANIHGRVLGRGPLSEDVVSFRLMTADGRVHECSRIKNPDLFSAAIGGYGLVGVILTVTLTLARRRKIERVVRLVDLRDLEEGFSKRLEQGCLYGDFQFVTDETSKDFLQRGILSCYRPLNGRGEIPTGQIYMNDQRWQDLLFLAHTDKARAFEQFSSFYLSTHGQRYWSDTHQLSLYLDDYHRALDQRLGGCVKGTEMITELYVPLPRIESFMASAAESLKRHNADLIYGTVRLIRRDRLTLLAWAREDFACVIFNLHVTHDQGGIAASRSVFRALVDDALSLDGSYFLTYHRHAHIEQLRRAYPGFDRFMAFKRRVDPDERFASDWYRHYRSALVAPETDEQLTG